MKGLVLTSCLQYEFPIVDRTFKDFLGDEIISKKEEAKALALAMGEKSTDDDDDEGNDPIDNMREVTMSQFNEFVGEKLQTIITAGRHDVEGHVDLNLAFGGGCDENNDLTETIISDVNDIIDSRFYRYLLNYIVAFSSKKDAPLDPFMMGKKVKDGLEKIWISANLGLPDKNKQQFFPITVPNSTKFPEEKNIDSLIPIKDTDPECREIMKFRDPPIMKTINSALLNRVVFPDVEVFLTAVTKSSPPGVGNGSGGDTTDASLLTALKKDREGEDNGSENSSVIDEYAETIDSLEEDRLRLQKDSDILFGERGWKKDLAGAIDSVEYEQKMEETAMGKKEREKRQEMMQRKGFVSSSAEAYFARTRDRFRQNAVKTLSKYAKSLTGSDKLHKPILVDNKALGLLEQHRALYTGPIINDKDINGVKKDKDDASPKSDGSETILGLGPKTLSCSSNMSKEGGNQRTESTSNKMIELKRKNEEKKISEMNAEDDKRLDDWDKQIERDFSTNKVQDNGKPQLIKAQSVMLDLIAAYPRASPLDDFSGLVGLKKAFSSRNAQLKGVVKVLKGLRGLLKRIDLNNPGFQSNKEDETSTSTSNNIKNDQIPERLGDEMLIPPNISHTISTLATYVFDLCHEVFRTFKGEQSRSGIGCPSSCPDTIATSVAPTSIRGGGGGGVGSKKEKKVSSKK